MTIVSGVKVKVWMTVPRTRRGSIPPSLDTLCPEKSGSSRDGGGVWPVPAVAAPASARSGDEDQGAEVPGAARRGSHTARRLPRSPNFRVQPTATRPRSRADLTSRRMAVRVSTDQVADRRVRRVGPEVGVRAAGWARQGGGRADSLYSATSREH